MKSVLQRAYFTLTKPKGSCKANCRQLLLAPLPEAASGSTSTGTSERCGTRQESTSRTSTSNNKDILRILVLKTCHLNDSCMDAHTPPVGVAAPVCAADPNCTTEVYGDVSAIHCTSM